MADYKSQSQIQFRLVDLKKSTGCKFSDGRGPLLLENTTLSKILNLLLEQYNFDKVMVERISASDTFWFLYSSPGRHEPKV